MSLTLEPPPEKEAAFRAHAQALGLSIEQWILKVADQQIRPVSIAHLQKADPKEWARQFDEWVDSHKREVPVLSDDSMSRDSIYPDRI